MNNPELIELLRNEDGERQYIREAKIVLQAERSLAADRIEELEAKLTNVVDAMENLLIAIGMGWDLGGVVEVAKDVLAELEGEKK